MCARHRHQRPADPDEPGGHQTSVVPPAEQHAQRGQADLRQLEVRPAGEEREGDARADGGAVGQMHPDHLDPQCRPCREIREQEGGAGNGTADQREQPDAPPAAWADEGHGDHGDHGGVQQLGEHTDHEHGTGKEGEHVASTLPVALQGARGHGHRQQAERRRRSICLEDHRLLHHHRVDGKHRGDRDPGHGAGQPPPDHRPGGDPHQRPGDHDGAGRGDGAAQQRPARLGEEEKGGWLRAVHGAVEGMAGLHRPEGEPVGPLIQVELAGAQIVQPRHQRDHEDDGDAQPSGQAHRRGPSDRLAQRVLTQGSVPAVRLSPR